MLFLTQNPQITIKFYAPLERWVGKKTIIVNALTVEQAFVNAGEKIGKSLINHLINQDTSTVKSHYHILLNGLDIETHEGLETKLEEKDVITIVPPIGGG